MKITVPPLDPPPRGRPLGSTRAGPHTRLSVWLPTQAADRLIRLAASQEQSISKTIRQLLILKLR